MKLFCFKDHDAKPDYEDQLLHVRARLAKYKKLPTSYFTRIPGSNYQQIAHGVDEKPKVIAELEGTIAELEILISGEKS